MRSVVSRRRRALAAALLGTVTACAAGAPSAPTPLPAAAAAATVAGPSIPVTRADAAAVARTVAPATAFARGWMPLAATGVPELLRAHPTFDGRGVLIAILDSGIDPLVPGLDSTSTGARKLLDLRDLSGEGRVALEAFLPAGDSLPAPYRLLGGEAVRALSPDGPWYIGAFREPTLGRLPAADVTGDGDMSDTLAVVVARDAAGWFVLADTDLNGTLAGEEPVRDYAADGRTLAWAPPGASPRLGVAVNLAERDHAPVLDLFFDTSGHGTHVAGIAAGRRIYGVPGFDGVAPGAQVLGLKISDNAHGAVSTSGSMLAAVRHALAVADARGMPLVLNLSFGVGNEREGSARVDALLDSVLAARPDVVLTISAGNDGPGLSTVGFPGTASAAITVGATLPRAFLPSHAAGSAADAVAAFSARGGERSKPDLVAPGIAYSTVPRWNAGQERNGGTSMAAPHAAGLAALLLSGAVQLREPVDAATVRAALLASARPVPGSTPADAGAGVPDVAAAWRWMAAGRRAPDVVVRSSAGAGSAVLYGGTVGAEVPRETVFELRRPAAAVPRTYRLAPDAAWLRAPDSIVLGPDVTPLVLRHDAAALSAPGVRSGSVAGWPVDSSGRTDTLAGPAFRLLTTIVTAYPSGAAADTMIAPLAPSGVGRVVFEADSGRAFHVSVAGAGAPSAYLHEPGGRPHRGGVVRAGASRARPAVFEVDAADAERGIYEIVVAAPATRAAEAAVSIRHAPLRVRLIAGDTAIQAELEALAGDTVRGEATLLLVGGERAVEVSGTGGTERRLEVALPEWTATATIEIRQPSAQWGRFTDFGATVYSAEGAVLEQSPLNYAVGRLALADPPAGRTAVVGLLPGLADAHDAAPWSVEVRVRAYAGEPVAIAPLADPAAATLALPPGSRTTILYPSTAGPWPLADGFHPLAVFVAESDGVTWSREASLAPTAVPITP